MKRILLALTALMVFMLVGCQETRDAMIPIQNPEYLAIYNGGEIIYEAFIDDGEIEITAEKMKSVTISLGDTTEYWLVYSITQNGVTTKIVDSDTLCIVWID